MRRFTSAFQTGPLLPGVRTLVAGGVTAVLAGWLIVAANGRVPDPATTAPAISAPPTVAAHVVAPPGVQEALSNTLARQMVLLESLRARLETRTRELELVRVELRDLAAVLAQPAHVPPRKPMPGDPLPSTDRRVVLESEQARLEADRGEINRRIATTEAFIAEARSLMTFSSATPAPKI
ncbi:hypothetical protein ACM64Y_13015 [Novispirillum sp. DQ9]|uniref:hypothetical protein n=1 Tax=Novispirillum sp. DQ9 TaxID=3398612 RepID=UPI003C7C70F8